MINLLRTNNKLVDLVHLVLTITWYTFNFQFYQQAYRVAMGGSASSTTAKTYLQIHKQLQY